MSPRTPKPSGRPTRPPALDTQSDLRRRPSDSRSERGSFLILCEGKTEQLYFTGMRSRHGPQLAVDVPERDHRGIVQEAIGRRTAEYDEVWCVLDTELDAALAGDLIAEAEKGGIELALSTPCFEVWLILHLDGCARPFQTADEAKKKLSRMLPDWSESETRYSDFKRGVFQACDRARRLEADTDDPMRNPSTGVWRLVERILARPSR